MRFTNDDDDDDNSPPVVEPQHCDHAITTTTRNEEVVCESCGLTLDSELNIVGLPFETKSDEYKRKAAGVSAIAKSIDRSQRRIHKADDRCATKRARDELTKTKDDTRRHEKRQRMKHRESTVGASSFVASCMELMAPSYSSVIAQHHPVIESTLNRIYQSNIVNQCPIVVAYILHDLVAPSIALVELRSTIKGFTEMDVSSCHAASRMQSISTALANIDKMNAPVVPRPRSPSPPPPSSASSPLNYFKPVEAVTKMHTPETVRQIKLHIDTLCLLLGESHGTQTLTDENADQLIEAVHVGVRNREAIAGAVLYLLIGLHPNGFSTRSFKRIQQTTIQLWEANNQMRDERHILLLNEESKELPIVHPSLLANNGALFISRACTLQFGVEVKEDSDEIDWEPDANDVADPVKDRRTAYINEMKFNFPPYGVPSPTQISQAIRDDSSHIHQLCLHLYDANLLGDIQTVWANAFELQQLRGHSTGQAMRTTAIAIKQSMPAAIRSKMRPIQSCLTEWINDESRQDLMWAHIEDLSNYYLRRLFASRFGATKTNAWKDLVRQRLAMQFKKARLVCGVKMFKQEHEPLAATFIVSCMQLYFNQAIRIKARELYKGDEVCGDDVSASTISVCLAKLRDCNGVLECETS